MTKDTKKYKKFKRPELKLIPDFIPFYGHYTYTNRQTHEYSSFADSVKKIPINISEIVKLYIKGLSNPSTRKESIDDLISLGSKNWPWKEDPKECTLTAVQNVLFCAYHIYLPFFATLYTFSKVL